MWQIPLTPIKEYNYVFFFVQGINSDPRDPYSRIIDYDTPSLSSQNDNSKGNSIEVQKQCCHLFSIYWTFSFY